VLQTLVGLIPHVLVIKDRRKSEWLQEQLADEAAFSFVFSFFIIKHRARIKICLFWESQVNNRLSPALTSWQIFEKESSSQL
jgi:hypothetical protein